MALISAASGQPLSVSSRPVGYVPDRHLTIYTVNESTGVDERTFWNWTWALQYQTDFQFGPAWGIAARYQVLPKGVSIPAGGMVLHFTDTLDVQGALGYHDEDGNEVPYGKIGVVTSQQDGVQPSAVGSHEALELLVDLHVNLTAINDKKRQVVAYEVGDPCQGNDYDVGAPESRPTGVIVADFALPNWFDPNTPTSAKTSYRGALHGPFVVGPQGYHAYVDLKAPLDASGNVVWRQSFGSDHVGAAGDVQNPL